MSERAFEVVLPYIQISRGILEQEAIIASGSSSKKEKKAAKDVINKFEQQFNEGAHQLVYEILSDFDADGTKGDLSGLLNSLLSDIKQAVLDDGDDEAEIIARAVDLTAVKLTEIAQKQQSKSPCADAPNATRLSLS